MAEDVEFEKGDKILVKEGFEIGDFEGEEGQSYEVYEDISESRARKAVEGGFASKEPHPPEETEVESEELGEVIVSDKDKEKLIGWLMDQNFRKMDPEKETFTRDIETEAGKDIRLVVNFEKSNKGQRFGYEFDEEEGEWKTEESLREHPLLKAYKTYRDGLLIDEEAEAKEEAFELLKPFRETERGMRRKDMEEIKEGMKEPPSFRGGGAIGGSSQMLQLEESEIGEKIKKDVMKEVTDKILERYCYEVKGQVRLTWQGVWAIARRRGGFSVEDLKVWKDDEGVWWAKCKVYDHYKDIGPVPGIVKQDPKNDPRVNPPFEERLASQKAIKRALERLIPTVPYEALIEKARERHDQGQIDISIG